jgi:hypothetical protein
MLVDFNAVRANALAEGIPLAEIAVIYQELTDDERNCLLHSAGGTVIARLAADDEQLFPEKAVGVYTLSA